MEEEFRYFEYDGMPFKCERKTLKVFAIGPGGVARPITEPDRASTLFARKRTISEKEALALAEMQKLISFVAGRSIPDTRCNDENESL